MQMKREELAEIILKTLNIFDFLQFVDECCENSDLQSRKLVNDYFHARYGTGSDEMQGVLPLAQMKTTLPILLVTVCFASGIKEEEWSNVDFSIKPQYTLSFTSDSNRINYPKVSEVIRTLRNACAHLPDLVGNNKDRANVSFDNGCVVFFSLRPKTETEVVFSTQKGFVAFLSDYLRAVRRLVRTNLLTPVI
jgi:hypothetical protein